ncbi:hypothetical protein BT96DRAFT_980442 [Gymnopus androsaceus JB14]|uniref:Uncharacterized protein n=1 Tax=Gymnopus androsaceus JB14 TaxID=1447944 RepID=A0A6A4GWG9_9AGAR|nr:hypothetical protein BT96DRAFT_980442 [Gymnopus androsaceus JB14]
MFGYKYLLVLVALTMISLHVQAAVIPQGNVEARDVTKRFPNVDSEALMSREPAVDELEFSRRDSLSDAKLIAEMGRRLAKHEKPTPKELREATAAFGNLAIVASKLGVPQSELE